MKKCFYLLFFLAVSANAQNWSYSTCISCEGASVSGQGVYHSGEAVFPRSFGYEIWGSAFNEETDRLGIGILQLDQDGVHLNTIFVSNTIDDTHLDAADQHQYLDDGEFVYVAGVESPPDNDETDYFIAQINGDYEINWKINLGPSSVLGKGISLLKSSDDQLLLHSIGQDANGVGQGDLVVSKVDTNGVVVWSTLCELSGQYGQLDRVVDGNIVEFPDGSIIVCVDANIGVSRAPALVKLDPNGTVVWNRIYTDDLGADVSAPNTHIVDQQNGFILMITNVGDLTKLVQVNLDGTLVSSVDLPDDGRKRQPTGIQKLENGNAIVIGSYENTAYLAEVEDNGTLLWERFIGELVNFPEIDTKEVNQILQTNQGLLCVGTFRHGDWNYDVNYMEYWALHLDEFGCYLPNNCTDDNNVVYFYPLMSIDALSKSTLPILSPNPSNGFVNISTRINDCIDCQLEIYNADGKLIFNEEVNGSRNAVELFNSGLYLCILRKDGVSISTQKLLVSR